MIVVLLAFLFFSVQICATPAALYFDPGIAHSICGVNRLPTDEKDWSFDLNLTPFYQHASSARAACGGKVPLGDRLGLWKTIPILWGDMAAAPKEFTANNYSTLYTFSKWASDLGGENQITPASYGGASDTDGDWSVPINYERLGMHLELDIAMSSGFGLFLKSGVVDYRMCPTFTDMSSKEGKEDQYLGPFLESIMSHTSRDALFNKDLGLKTKQYETVALEDSFIELYWSNRFECRDVKDNLMVTIAPFIGTGLWIPTGQTKDQNNAFSLPTGHDGFWGVSLEGAINFIFPETITFNVGGSVTFFETKNINCQRVPNHCYQQGIYPWKTDIKKTFGTAWTFNMSMFAKDILPDLNVYFDYLYSRHERDSITIKDCNSALIDIFYPTKLEADSEWKAQTLHLGLEYVFSPCVSLGVAGQTVISGSKVFKTNTIMGTASFTF